MAKRAVFLDRDGTVIPDKGYLDSIEGVELPDANARALARLCRAGFQLIIITNQSGVGRGYFPEEMVLKQHRQLQKLARPYGVSFAGLAYCPHAPDDHCGCRKPSPCLLQSEARRLDIDLEKSFMIGDKRSDVQAGNAAGCRTILLADTPDGQATWTVASLPAAVSLILADYGAVQQ